MNIRQTFPQLLAFVCASLVLSQCAPLPPPAPGSAEVTWTGRPAYRKGYHHGVQDGNLRLAPDYERHYREFTVKTAAPFEKGYDRGFETGLEESKLRPGDEEAVYQLGLEAGAADAESGLRPSSSRHAGSYTASSKAAFERGYLAGFNEAQRRAGQER